MVEPVKDVSRPTADVTLYDEGLRTFFANVFTIMAIGLAITAVVSQVVSRSPDLLYLLITAKANGRPSMTWLWWGLVIAELMLVVKLTIWASGQQVSKVGGVLVFATYAALVGFTMAPAIHAYTTASVTQVFAITASAFGACALWGYTTKRDLTGMGVFMTIGLFGLIIALVVNFFLQSAAISFAASVIGVVIFAGLTAWDMQMLRTMYYEQGKSPGLAIIGALLLYLDFLNLFQFLLHLFGVRDE